MGRLIASVVGAVLAAGVSAAAADCSPDVNAAFDNLRASKAFRLRTVIVNAEGSLKMTVDYLLPDRMHQTIMPSTATSPLELIVIGKRAWSSNGVAWSEMPEAYAEHVAEQVKQSVLDRPAQSASFSCLGDKELEGEIYAAYQGVIAAPPDQPTSRGGSSVQTVYVNKKTGLPERNIVTPYAGSDQRLFDGTFTYPERLAIEPPPTTAAP